MTRWVVAAVACAGLAAGPVRADETDDGWTNQYVWPREPKLDLRDEDGKLLGRFSNEARVLRSGREWVLVRHRSGAGPYEGHVRKDEVVRLADAVAYFTDQVKAHADDTWAYVCRAEALSRTGEHDRAIRDLSGAIGLAPSSRLYTHRGNLWSAKGNTVEAIADYTVAIRLDPQNADAFNNRGTEWYAAKGYEAARKDFDEAIRLEPRFPLAHQNRGRTWAAQGEYGKAVVDFTRALRLEPRYANAYAGRASVRERLGDYAAAAQDWQECIALDPESADRCNGLAWFLATCPDAKVRDGKRAVELATKACELTGWKRADDLDTLAAAHAEAGAFPEAVKYQKQALADGAWAKANGEEARKRLALYEAKKPYRQEPPAKK